MSRAPVNVEVGTARRASDRERESLTCAVVRPGIASQVLATAGVRPVSADEASSLCGHHHAGLWLPYHTLDGQPVMVDGKAYGRLRLEVPTGGMKYAQAPKTGVHAYFPPGLSALVHDGVALTIVEGEFKALALVAVGIPAIGISGFYGFQVAGGGALLPEIAAFMRERSFLRVAFLGDTDTALNWQFADAACKLRDLLPGIRVVLPRLPLDGPKGADDCIEAMGSGFPAWWEDRLAQAIVLPPATTPGQLTLQFLRLEKDHLRTAKAEYRDRLLSRIAEIGGRMQPTEPMALGELADFAKKAMGVNKLSLKDGAISAAAKLRRERSRPASASAGICEHDTTIRAEHGEPYYETDRGSLQLNQQYWAHKLMRGEDILFDPDENRFYLYSRERGLWEACTDARVSQMFAADMMRFAEQTGEPRIIPMRTRALCDDLSTTLTGIAERRNMFTPNHGLIHLADCMIDLRGGSPAQCDFAAEYFSRNQSPIAFDIDAQCPRFINELLKPALPDEDISLIQRWAGSLLLGGNRAQRFLVLTGTPNGGKGTLVNVIESIIGSENVTQLRTQHLDERFEIGRFVGKTLLCGKDVPSNFLEYPSAQALKSLVGHDGLHGELKNSNGTVPVCGDFGVVIASNSPVLRLRLDRDNDAWRRRLLLVKYERPPPVKRNPWFKEELLETEGSGILNWMIVGAVLHKQELTERGDFVLTAAQSARIDSLLEESDSMRAFCQKRLAVAEGADATSSELSRAYNAYCSQRGWQPLPAKDVQQRITQTLDELYGIKQAHDIVRAGAGTQRGFHRIRIVEGTDQPGAAGLSEGVAHE